MSCDSISDDGYSPSSDRLSPDSSSDDIKKTSDDGLGPSSDDEYGIVTTNQVTDHNNHLK